MDCSFEKISVVGLGYIGLPTAAMLASRGIKVIGVDIDKNTVDTINNGKVHIVEPDLDIIVHSVVNTHYLRAVTKPEKADAFLITVPTPFKVGFKPDLSNVHAAIASIAPVLENGNLIILESTSPVGTTKAIANQLSVLRPDLIFPDNQNNVSVHIAYCPERVMPGQIIKELVENDRIIGGLTIRCAEKAKALYSLFVRGECIITDSKTAEMSKLTENAFRDVNIAFANELSLICDKLNINVWELIKLANRHPRVNILQPGPGVGGHCLAVDPWFIVDATPKEARLIRTAREVNDSKPLYILEKIIKAAEAFENPSIACLGIAYKPNTDDLRESPSIKILEQLAMLTDYPIHIVEPNIKQLPSHLENVSRFHLLSLNEAIKKSDIIVLMVPHNEFKSIIDLSFENKTFICVVSLEDKISDFNNMSNKIKNQNRPVSEYGLMMLNRIYGRIV